MWQSTGSGNPYFITPLQFFNAGADINTKFVLPSNKNFTWTLQVLDEQMNLVGSDSKYISSSGLYTINLPASVPNGAYYLKFLFSGNGNNQCYVDRIYYNSFLINGANCAGGINFMASSTKSPGDFFPVGSSTVTYTATYTPVSGSPITQTCSFNVVVNKVSISNVSTTPTTCNGNNGNITFTASSANTSANHLEYSLDGTTWYPISGGNVVTTTPQAGTTTTSWQATMTIPALYAQTYNLQVRDTQKGCTPASQSVTVNNTADTQKPVINCAVSSTQTVDANTGTTYVQSGTGWDATATDDCGSPSLTYTLTNATTGSGGATLNGVAFNEGTTTVTWKASDATGNYSTCSFDVVVNASADLSIVKTVESAQVIAGQELKYKIVVSNPSGPSYARNVIISDAVNAFTSPMYSTDDVTYLPWTGSYNVPGTIAKSSSVTLYIKGTLSVNQCSSVSNTATVTSYKDNVPGNNTSTVTSTVQDKTPPVITCPGDITINCDESQDPSHTGIATATDNCTSSGSITINHSDQIVTGSCANNYTIKRTWTATDQSANTSSCIQTITVQDITAPAITGTLTPIAIEGCTAADRPSATNTLAYLRANGLTISDACGDAGLTVSSIDGAPSGSCPVTIIRTYTVTDACGNHSSAQQTITVNDNTAPAITGTLTPIAIEGCTAADRPSATNTLAYLRANGLTISDACGDAGLTVSSIDGAPSGSCPVTIIRTYTVTDACGNHSSAQQTITVND
ncbi:HYR domain-containing protein, partial [Paludibacter sp.]|uniref:HYR domain-containing protein n=1 Tax=Paludibacter sp. TaxID=1898105 RepID=UPI0025E65EE9